MRTKLLLLPFAMLATQSSADEPWPIRYKHVKVVFTVVGSDTLPKPINDLLVADVADAQIPDNTRVARVDLNSDGNSELILEYRRPPTKDPSPQFAIFQKQGEKFTLLGHLPGEFHICQSANNYYQLETWQEHFPSGWHRYLFRFQRGRYRSVQDDGTHLKRF